MADGGASSFILLATALLISGAISAVLITQYGDITSAMEKDRREAEADSKTSFNFAGDLSNIAYDTTNPIETITFYLQNTGEYVLDENSLFIQVNGAVVADVDVATSVLPAGGTWGSSNLLEVEISGAWTLADNTDVKLTVFVQSVIVSNYDGEHTESTVVRLNEV